jgi:hypothetical protein
MTDQPIFSEHERGAMRAYLQRCEVRLSTMHRVATAFISGAGIIVLIPVFLKDIVSELIQILLTNFQPTIIRADWLPGLALYGALSFVLYLLLFLPLRALYLTFKDIIDFYFTIHTPGFPEELPNPTFALTGVAFSPDESKQVKDDVLRYEYQRASIDFMLPFSRGKRIEYFGQFDQNAVSAAVQQDRDSARLRRDGLVADDVTDEEIRHFNAAMAIGRTFERTLVEEVAKSEMSLTRHSLYLRRIVLRYVKTILIFIWTLLILFAISSVIRSGGLPFVSLSAGCLIWTLPITWLLHTPISWIYRPLTRAKDPTQPHPISDALKGIADFVMGPKMEPGIDRQLVVMEMNFMLLRHVAVVASVIALLLSLYFML